MLCADLAPLYEHLCKELEWQIDAAQLEGMKARNTEKLKELDEKIKDAEENLGETEVRDAVQAKADYYAQIGDRDAAAKAYQDTESKTASVATKTDLVFNQIRWAAQQQTSRCSYCCVDACVTHAVGITFPTRPLYTCLSNDAASSLAPTEQVRSNPDAQGCWSITWLHCIIMLTSCAPLPQAQHPVQRLAHGEAAAGAREAAVRVRRRLGAQEQAQGAVVPGGEAQLGAAGALLGAAAPYLCSSTWRGQLPAVVVHAGQAVWPDGQAAAGRQQQQGGSTGPHIACGTCQRQLCAESCCVQQLQACPALPSQDCCQAFS
jgi:hypothetical protein